MGHSDCRKARELHAAASTSTASLSSNATTLSNRPATHNAVAGYRGWARIADGIGPTKNSKVFFDIVIFYA